MLQIGFIGIVCVFVTFIAGIWSIPKLKFTWKQPKCPSIHERIKQMWYIYTMEYYSAIKKTEILPFAMTWMELESIMLREISQSVKDKYNVISLRCGI
uniref:DUF1725 domain-containing protein n=2 Tax=Canis lupus TaxID=9612 RepID=A0A8P0TMZ3_CANLF